MKKRRPSPKRATSTTTSSRKAKSRGKRKKRKKSIDAAARQGRIAFLSLGSNRGDRRSLLERALAAIGRSAPILRASSFYRTEPVGFAAQPHFWNLVAAIRWTGSAASLLRLTQSVEHALGRTPTFRNGPREIDVDILDLGGQIRAGTDPILPHPRMTERRFVLAPLDEIAPRWRHPVTGRTARQLLRILPERPRATRLSSSPRGFASPVPES